MLPTQVEVPSKYDIIPLHTSDRATFKQCRRHWNWSSPARSNLVPKASIYGIREPLWFGTGIHYALEKFYDPTFTEDVVIAWETWWDLQVNGGYITEAELPEFIDRNPWKTDEGDVYRVAGLADVLPVFDAEHFNNLKKLGTGMMEFYKDYASREDNFTVIDVEHTFSVPLFDKDGPLYMYDSREMPDYWSPEEFGKENKAGSLMKWLNDGPDSYLVKQVHARGRVDLIIQDNETGRYGIIDFKTTSRLDEDYYRHLDLDEQVTTYAWALEQEALLYDLPYKQIDFVIYQAMLKAYPVLPTITSRGLPSLNRADESTTAQLFMDTVDAIGLRGWYERDEKAQAYVTWLMQQGDARFVDRHIVRRNTAQKANCGRRLTMEALDMLDANLRLYPNPTKDYRCLNCVFRQPCISMEDGSDWQSMIEDGYEVNYDR